MATETIFPSAGHHLNDPGATYHGYTESGLMIRFRDKVIAYLLKLGYKVIPDRDHETNSQYQSRIKPGVGSVLVDYHANAVLDQKASGSESFVADNANAQSVEMATQLNEATCSILRISNRGVKKPSQSARGKIGILSKPGIVVLHELFFISNKSDLDKFLAKMDELAYAHALILGKFEDLIK